MSMSQIPWSAEGELQLRNRTVLWRAYTLLALALAISFLVFQIIYKFIFLGSLALTFWVACLLCARKLAHAVDQLGREEIVWRGTRIPGSGMLQNKPRETSRLTTWIHHRYVNVEKTGDRTVRCRCGNTFDVEEFKWIANLLEYEEEESSVAVDPEGGRYVLICPCGIGHYMLRGK